MFAQEQPRYRAAHETPSDDERIPTIAAETMTVQKDTLEDRKAAWGEHNLNNLVQVALARANILGLPEDVARRVADEYVKNPDICAAARTSDFVKYLDGDIPDDLLRCIRKECAGNDCASSDDAAARAAKPASTRENG